MGQAEDDVFKGWMAAHIALLHRIARGFASGADQHDLMQELMLAVWRAAPAFRGDAKETTFIYRVAHNAALTWSRRQARNAQRQREATRAAADMEISADPLLDRLYAAIHALEKLDRSLMLLALEGLSYAAIAEIHGLSESNVGARLTRARKKIAEMMEKDDEF